MIDVDVLIVGGGAQGLWLLNDLSKRHYRAILLERWELGGGQTCHSHGLIHRGHYYDDTDMMIILNAAAQFWEAFVDEKGLTKLNPSRALAGFGPGTAVERHKYFWDTAGLRFDACVDKPEIFGGGKVRHLFETEEFSLDPSEVVAGLARDVDHATYKLEDRDGALQFVKDKGTIKRVEAIIDGEHVEIAPTFVIFAAGVGNYGLLAQLGAETNEIPLGTPVQAQRKNHMLVVRGRNLPIITAVFPIRGGLQGVFLCPRVDPDTAQPVWLASDHNSVPFAMSSDESSHVDAAPSGEWIKRMLVSLRATAPALFRDESVHSLDLAVYTGLTSERNFGIGQHQTDMYIDPFRFDNLLTIWPTKLTMTPFASNVAIRFVRLKVLEPSGAWPTVDRDIRAPAPRVASEMWCKRPFEAAHAHKTSWMPYADFIDRWRVSLD